MEPYEIVLSAFITIFALGLFIISLSSYKKFRSMKLLFVSVVFLVFIVKGVLFSLEIFDITLSGVSILSMMKVFDLFILILLFIATLKR